MGWETGERRFPDVGTQVDDYDVGSVLVQGTSTGYELITYTRTPSTVVLAFEAAVAV